MLRCICLISPIEVEEKRVSSSQTLPIRGALLTLEFLRTHTPSLALSGPMAPANGFVSLTILSPGIAFTLWHTVSLLFFYLPGGLLGYLGMRCCPLLRSFILFSFFHFSFGLGRCVGGCVAK